MLNPAVLHVVLAEPAEEYGIPELRCDTKIFAASHQSVGLGTLDGVGDTFSAEKVVDTL